MANDLGVKAFIVYLLLSHTYGQSVEETCSERCIQGHTSNILQWGSVIPLLSPNPRFFLLFHADLLFPESVQLFLICKLNVKEDPLVNTELVTWFLHLFSESPLLPV